MVWVDSYLPEPNSRGFRARNASRLIRENSCGIEVSLKSGGLNGSMQHYLIWRWC